MWTAEIAELLGWTMARTVSVLQGLVHRGLVQWGYTQSGEAHEGCWRIDRKSW
jgi:DNA-binding IclR family transcriptional regulator